MTREELKLKGIIRGLATLLLPFLGLAALQVKPLAPLGLFLFYGGPPALLFVFVWVKRKEKKIAWRQYRCPHCGKYFEAEPGAGKVKHLLCKKEVYIKAD